jgi:hypothetical protein
MVDVQQVREESEQRENKCPRAKSPHALLRHPARGLPLNRLGYHVLRAAALAGKPGPHLGPEVEDHLADLAPAPGDREKL